MARYIQEAISQYNLCNCIKKSTATTPEMLQILLSSLSLQPVQQERILLSSEAVQSTSSGNKKHRPMTVQEVAKHLAAG